MPLATSYVKILTLDSAHEPAVFEFCESESELMRGRNLQRNAILLQLFHLVRNYEPHRSDEPCAQNMDNIGDIAPLGKETLYGQSAWSANHDASRNTTAMFSVEFFSG